MKLVYIVSMFIIILIALISPRKEYFNLNEPCYKNLGNKNSYGSELTFNNNLLDNVLSKDSQISKGDSNGDEITNNLREFNRQKNIAIMDVQFKEEIKNTQDSTEGDIFAKKTALLVNNNDKLEESKNKADLQFETHKRNITRKVYDKIMADGELKLSNTVQDSVKNNIKSIGLGLSKSESIPGYTFNGLNLLKKQFDSFKIDNSNSSKETNMSVVPVNQLKPNGCYTMNDYDQLKLWVADPAGCQSFGINERDYWKNNWNHFAVITSVDPGGKLPFATLNGKDVWLKETYREKSAAQDYVNSLNKTIFDWQSYPSPAPGSFPIRVNPITRDVECLENNGQCDTTFGTDMSKINNNADTVKCHFDGTDLPWCKEAYNRFSNEVDTLNYNICPKGWNVIDSSTNICEAPINIGSECKKKILTNDNRCDNKNCIKIKKENIRGLIDDCGAYFKFNPNANAIANNKAGIKESVNNSVKALLGTSTVPISSNVDRFDFSKKGILVKVYEAEKSNGIIVKGPAVGPRNYGYGNTVYIVNNINFRDSQIILNSNFSQYRESPSQQVFIEFIGYIKIPENTEKITFQTEGYQGSRFYFNIGNELINVIDSWSNSGIKQSKPLNVRPNTFNAFKLEYFLDTGVSTIKLSWKLNNENTFQIISRDNFFLDTEQCNRLTSMPDINTIIDKKYKTYPGISGINSLDSSTLNTSRLGTFETVDECAKECDAKNDCKGFTYSTDNKSCYKFDTQNPKFSKDPKTNSYVKKDTQSIYGSYNNSLEVPMRKMITITDRGNIIRFNGLDNVLKGKFTIEMWIYINTFTHGPIYLFSINPNTPGRGQKIIFKLNTNFKLDVDFGYPPPIVPIGDESNSDNDEKPEPTISPNIWTHVAMTYSNNIAKIFINGKKIKEISQGPFISVRNEGYIAYNDSTRPYKMSIDEIRIWSTDLNENTLSSYMRKDVDNKHSNNNNLAWYSNMNITNRQMFNKCNEYIGSGCDQNIKATFNNDPININSDSPLA